MTSEKFTWRETARYPDSEEDLNELYTKWADTYDKDLQSYNGVGIINTMKIAFEYIRDCESSLMLDVAAGTGRSGQICKDMGYKGQIDGIDMNSKMLEVAKSKAIYRELFRQRIEEDEPLPIKDGTYDVVTVTGGLMMNHLPQRCIGQLVKVLKPGGILIFNSRIGPENQKYVEGLMGYADELVAEKVIELEKKEKVQYGGVGDGKIYAYAWVYRKI